MRQAATQAEERGLKTNLQHATVGGANGPQVPVNHVTIFKKTSLPLKKKKKDRDRQKDFTSQKPLETHAAVVLRRRRQGQTDKLITWTVASQSSLNLIFFLSPPFRSGCAIRSI